MNIYVGNISREATEDDVRELFEQYGTVTSVALIKDKFTKQLKGFGFVEMSNENESANAIKNLDGQQLNGRPLTVSEAKPKAQRTGKPDYRRRY